MDWVVLCVLKCGQYCRLWERHTACVEMSVAVPTMVRSLFFFFLALVAVVQLPSVLLGMASGDGDEDDEPLLLPTELTPSGQPLVRLLPF